MTRRGEPRALWRFDWRPELRDLVLREAEALGAGALVAPGLFLGAAPFEAGRAALAVGGGEVVVEGSPGSPLPLPAGADRVHVPRGPWKVSGNPVDFLARLGWPVSPARRGCSLELYVTAERWYLVRTPVGSPHFRPPNLPIRTSTSLSSRLARAVVNLVARPGETVLDPVCGTGVLLVEAARLGCRAVGWDSNPKACRAARENLAATGLPARVFQRDALSRDLPGGGFDALVGDLPYGRRLASHDLEPFLRALPPRANRWALVAHHDLGEQLRRAGHPPRYAVRVPKPTFCRYVLVGPE